MKHLSFVPWQGRSAEWWHRSCSDNTNRFGTCRSVTANFSRNPARDFAASCGLHSGRANMTAPGVRHGMQATCSCKAGAGAWSSQGAGENQVCAAGDLVLDKLGCML